MKRSVISILLSIILLALFNACGEVNSNGNGDALSASGTIAAKDINVAPEIGGKVIEVLVEEGAIVSVGDVLLRVDDELLVAQYTQVATSVDAARATVDAAKAQLASAEIQHELVLQGARMQEIETRTTAWSVITSDEIELPTWYYVKDERITALETEVQVAQDYLEDQLVHLEKELQNVSNGDFIAAETYLAEVQTTFSIAALTLLQAQDAADRDVLQEIAQEAYDAVLADLESAQLDYDRLLTSTAADDLMKARAHVALAYARLNNAQDQLTFLLSGEQSLQVKASQAGVEQARTAVTQAEANLAQAEAALQIIAIQLEKTVARAPISGVILSQNLSVGELISAGSTTMTIGQLDEVELTVYIPEDKYGTVQLGQEVYISVDSFPGSTFAGTVVHIANQAEFTPSNVQTVEGRKTTVYAVKITVPNQDQKLKPGMPADVNFDISP